MVFSDQRPSAQALFFVRHWGVLILAFGALIFYSAHMQTIRNPILIAAAAEKFALVLFIFLGPVKRTPAMTALAAMDTLFALLYVASLAGI